MTRQPPRVVTVLAGLGLVTLVLGLLAVVSPTVRDQLALSVSRQDAPYVETSFADVDRVVTCNEGRPRFRATVSVVSHLDEAATLPVVLRLTPTDGSPATSVEAQVATVPGRESQVEVVARKPAGAYDAEVTFPGRDQRLVVHCAGAVG